MKTYQRRKIKLATFLLVLVFTMGTICGCFATTDNDGTSSAMGVNVTNISDQVNSLSAEHALASDQVSVFDKDDLCWVVVRFKDDSVLDRAMKVSPSDVYAYINSKDALSQASSITKAQSKFANKHSSVIKDTSFRYTALLNGMAVKVRYGDIDKLQKDSSVADVIICERYYAPEAVTQNEVNVYPTGIYNPGDVGYDGTGTIVAVLDTGLDYTHSAFQEQPTGNLSVDIDKVRGLLSRFSATEMSKAAEYDLTADALYVSDKVPFAFDYADVDADVYPTEDHGTHVAGIIAGHDETITGIATNAQLAIMKVFPDVEDKGASTEGILAALNDCVVLGVDAINMSLGSACGFSRLSDNEATNKIYDKIREVGICLICAAGNEYASSYQSEKNGDMSLATNPDYGTVGSPSSYEASMSVASISGVKTKYLMVNGEKEVYFTEAGTVNNNERHFASELLNDRPNAQFPYVVVPGLGTESNYYGLDVRGKIAVVKRGTLNFEDKINTAQSKGAVGVIIYNNVSGVITMSVGKSKVPACSVSMEFGKYFESHPTGTLVVDETYEAGPFMSEFSGWGPLPNLEFKPDITAHGGEILSAVRGGYDHQSGTSMAAPNLAGATILVRQYVKERFPEMSAYDVTELTYQLLMSTATIAHNEEGNPYSPRKQGAGLADIGKSVTASSYLYVEGTNKTKISCGDDPEKTGVYDLVFNVRNLGSTAQSYKINPIVMTESLSSDNKTVAQKAYMLGDTKYEISVDGAESALSGDTLTVLGYGSAQITVTLTLTDAAKAYIDKTFTNGTYVEGYVELLSQNNDVNLNIGYLAFYGDWSIAPMLDVTAFEVGEEQEDPSILFDEKLQPDIYATLPMGGFRYLIAQDEYEDSYFGMGEFAYKIADGYEAPAIREDKASLTTNMEGSYSLSLIAAGLLRNAKRVNWQIVDAVTGEYVASGVDYDVQKSFFSSTRYPGSVMINFNVNEYNLPNNGKYTFSMECELDWKSTENNLKNTFSFDFYVDNEAPMVVEERTQVRMEGTGNNRRYLLDIYAYDNHYIQGYQIGTFSSINPDKTVNDFKPFHHYVIPLSDGKRNTENKITYDITQYWNEIQKNNGNIYVELIDYAKNTAEFQLRIPSSNAEQIKFKSTTRSASVRVNEVVDLKDSLQMTPSNLWVQDLKWWITYPDGYDGEQVAIVRDGIVLGLAVGEATLHVSNGDGSAEATLPVRVQAARDPKVDVINLSTIQLNKTFVELERGEEFILTAKLLPFDLFPEYSHKFADINLVWSTSGGAIKFVVENPVTGKEEFVDSVSGVSEVKVRSFNEGWPLINVQDTKSPSYVNSNCNVVVKSEFEVEGGYLQSYTGRGDADGVVVIPDDLNIMFIYPYAFMNNEYITKIVFPEGLLQIMETSVYGCSNLREVEIPDTCTSIGKWAFGWNTSLEKVTLGGVKSIGELAFVGCTSLNDIDFSGVYSIGPRAFAYCNSLQSIDLSTVKSMGEQAFMYCEGLTEVTTGYYTPIGDKAFVRCTGLTEITLNGRLVGNSAFMFCTNLQRVTFNNAVDTIDYGAFYGCGQLSQVNFRSTVRVIGEFAFCDCAFETIIIPNGVESIGNFAFGFDGEELPEYGGPSRVIISAGAKLTTIGAGIFRNCEQIKKIDVEEDNAYLTSVNGIVYDKALRKVLLVPSAYEQKEITLPATVTEIGDFAFAVSSITSVTGANVTKIGSHAFDASEIEEVHFEKINHIGDFAFFDTPNFTKWPAEFANVSYVGDFAFLSYTTPLTGIQENVTLNNVSYLGSYAFAYTGITQVTVSSNNLKEIGESAFAGCQKLLNVTLPEKGLERIGAYAFEYCTVLQSLTMPDTVTSVGDGVFFACVKLSSVTLSKNITEISDWMFSICPALTRLSIPSNVTYIGDFAFAVFDVTSDGSITQFYQRSLNLTPAGSSGLNNVVYIGNYAFYGVSMGSINAPKAETIGSYAFAESVISNSVNLPAAITLGEHAFDSSTMRSISINNVATIGAYALANCTSLSTLTLPKAITLGEGALSNSGITEVTFGPLESIGAEAFAGTKITTLRLPATLKQIDTKGLYGAKSLAQVLILNNPTYFTDSQGVLYKRLSNGLYSLVYYPVALTNQSYTAHERTVKVESYAFAGSTNLTSVTLPERLQVLGAGAFYGCTNLTTVILNCAAAPVLEMIYDEDNGGILNHYYDTFETDTSAHTSAVTIKYPQNGTGYDAYNWRLYFNEAKKNIEAMNTISRTQSTIDTADTLEALDVNALTLDDITKLVLMRRIYASLSPDQQAFLSALVDTKLSQAEKQIAKLLDEQIAALPRRITLNDRAQIEYLRSLLDKCNTQIQSQVTKLNKLTDAEAKLATLAEGGADNSWMLPTFISIGAALLVAAAVVVTLVLVKRKKAQANQSTKEDANNEEE